MIQMKIWEYREDYWHACIVDQTKEVVTRTIREFAKEKSEAIDKIGCPTFSKEVLVRIYITNNPLMIYIS